MNKQESIEFLRKIFQPKDVFEIRILDALTRDFMRPHIVSGYFDYDHIETAVNAIQEIRGYKGVYVTVNPVNPDLHARAYNRIRAAQKEPTTSDGDVEIQRWLLIDCDPKRVSGVSSSEMEHENAILCACDIRDTLMSLGWPEPVVLDSGNGAQLMWYINLPVTENQLIQQCIHGIATASNEYVSVDLSVYNPARIWRLPGTMNCKGDNIPERPHRQATVLSFPEKLEQVPKELLQQAASWSAPSVQPLRAEPGEFDIDSWISKYCPELGQPKVWNSGRKWVFQTCPFNDAHNDRSAVLLEQPNGAIAFRCHHNGCAGNSWHKLREMLEPGCYDKKEENLPEVDCSNLIQNMNSKPAEPKEEAVQPTPTEQSVTEPSKTQTAFPDPGEMPKKLLKIPGFIDDFIHWALSKAPHPNLEIQFCAALAFLSYVLGRKIKSNQNTLPNIYIVALADSGVGKDQPRKNNMLAAVECAMGTGVIEDFTSGGGLEDMLFLTPTLLVQKDEMDTLFNMLKNTKDTNSETIIEKLLRMYGSSNSVWKMRVKAMARNDLLKLKNGNQEMYAQTIYNPYVTIFGTAIPEYFYNSLSQRVLGNGLAARCLFIKAGGRSKAQKVSSADFPQHLKDMVEIYKSYSSANGNLNQFFPNLKIIETTPEAEAILDKWNNQFEELYNQYEKLRVHHAMAFWARAFEKVIKLSLLYAASANPRNPIVTEEAAQWAGEFVEFVTKQALFLASTYSYDNPFDEKAQKIIRYLREAGGSMARGALLKRTHESKELFDKVIETLIENETVSVELVPGNGRVKRVYHLLEDSKTKE